MTTQAAPTTETPKEELKPVTSEGTPAETPVAEAPAAPVAMAPAAPATPAAPAPIDPQVQEYIARLEKSNREAEAKAEQETITAAAVVRQQELESYGLAPEQAQAIAQRESQLVRQAAIGVKDANAKWAYAVQISEQYKVPVASLMLHTSPAAIENAAKGATAESRHAAEIAALQAQVDALKKAQVPAQTFDNGRGDVRSEVDYDKLLREGKPLPSSKEIDALTAKYLR